MQILALCQNMVIFPLSWTSFYHNAEIPWLIVFMFGTATMCQGLCAYKIEIITETYKEMMLSKYGIVWQEKIVTKAKLC